MLAGIDLFVVRDLPDIGMFGEYMMQRTAREGQTALALAISPHPNKADLGKA